MPFFAPDPGEVDRFYSQPGMAEQEPHARLVSGRHRTLHADGQQSESPDGARAQSQLSAASPIRAKASPGDEAAGLLEGRRQAHAVHRQGRVQPGEGGDPVLEQVPAGLLRRVRHHLRQLRPGGADGRHGRAATHARRWSSRASACRPPWRPRSSTWASTCSTRWSAASRSARASCARRSPSRIDQEEYISIFRNGRGIAAQGPIPPGIFGYPRRRGRASIATCTTGSTASRSASPIEAAQEAAGRGGLSRRHRRKHRQAADHLLRQHRRRRRAPRPRSTG